MNADFWRGRRVFITGHTGFKGAWLSFWLAQLGADVTGFALVPDTEPNLFTLLGIKRRIVSRFGDIREFADFKKAAHAANPDIFFHLAAQAQVREGYAHPARTFETNVMGTANALEVAREIAGLRAMLVVTSDKCYRNDSRLGGYREEDALGGDDPYSCSKACAELITESYRMSFFKDAKCGVATARAGNIVGGGDWSQDRIVPDVVRALMGESTLRLRNPAATRPWQHVLDPLYGYLTLAERLATHGDKFAGPWNFGPAVGDSVTVGDLVGSIQAAWNSGRNWEHDTGPNPPESQRLAVDATKAREQLEWEPRLSSSEMVEWTVEWYKRCRSDKDAVEITSEQIERFQQRGLRRALSTAQH